MLFLMLLFYTYLIYFFNSFDLSYVLFDTVDLDLIHRHTLCKMTKMWSFYMITFYYFISQPDDCSWHMTHQNMLQ